MKEGTAAAASASDCNLVCVPPVETVERVAGTAANALSVTDPEKLQIFLMQAIASLNSGDPREVATAVNEVRKFVTSLFRSQNLLSRE